MQACVAGLSFDNPTRVLWEAAAAVPFTAFCAAALIGTPQTAQKACGLPGHGPARRRRPAGYQADFSYRSQAQPASDTLNGIAALDRSELVDVLIAGSGFGGSITAWRLAELYRAAGVDPKAIAVLERGRRYGHTDFRQSMDIDHLSDVYLLIQGQGAQVVTANAVGGGSNLYLAASLRSPPRPSSAATASPATGRRAHVAGGDLARLTRPLLRPRRARRCASTGRTWNQVSKSGGLWAATLADAGPHLRPRSARDLPERCVNAKWCHTGCIFGAKNSLITNYLWAAENAGVQVMPNLQVEQVSQSESRPYRYIVTADVIDNEGPEPDARARPASRSSFECKVLVARHRRDGHPAAAAALAPVAARAVGAGGQEPGRQR